MCFLILVFKLPSTAAAAAAHFKEKVSSDVRTTQAPPGEAELTHHTHSKKTSIHHGDVLFGNFNCVSLHC